MISTRFNLLVVNISPITSSAYVNISLRYFKSPDQSLSMVNHPLSLKYKPALLERKEFYDLIPKIRLKKEKKREKSMTQ